MSELTNKIKEAQKIAGEEVIATHLKKIGLVNPVGDGSQSPRSVGYNEVASQTDLLADLRNKLTPLFNLAKMTDTYLNGEIQTGAQIALIKESIKNETKGIMKRKTLENIENILRQLSKQTL